MAVSLYRETLFKYQLINDDTSEKRYLQFNPRAAISIGFKTTVTAFPRVKFTITNTRNDKNPLRLKTTNKIRLNRGHSH